ncbi:zinc finger protein 726-like isoform X2 [Dreissena polymorpha]|nr:zinc finger protein 726-like isoform X2 [Dreissena polymorpha]
MSIQVPSARRGTSLQLHHYQRMTSTPEKDKPEYSPKESNLASCMNMEPLDNNHFLYCGECNKEPEVHCPAHGPYNYIQDKEVPEGDPLKAEHTLPDCLEIKTSKIAGAGLGVFSKEGLQSKIMFGPYGGAIITDNHKSGYCWKDGKEATATSNWMRYVNCAMKEADTNLVALQNKEGIYYCTLKPVSPGEELLVWYGVEFSRELVLIRDKNSQKHTKIHKGKRQYKCEVCGLLCKHSSILKIHMRIHSGERPYMCDKCGFACNKSSTLKTHMRTHSGERLFKCEVCGHACNKSGNLKNHMRMHTGERPYICEVCGKTYKLRDNLKTHIMKHTGERPYKCEICDYSCTRSCDLKTHMKKHTGERLHK